MKDTLAPKHFGERVALFRVQVIGPLLNRPLLHGELSSELRALADRRFRPPGSDRTRAFSFPTLLRWYREYKKGGLEALAPISRKRGHALMLTTEQQKLLIDIRREYPHAPAKVILDTLEDEGRVERGSVSAETVRRLYRHHGLRRKSRRHAKQDCTDGRRRWEAEHVGDLWHADVCHGSTLVVGKRRIPVRIHAIMDDKSRYVVALRVLDHEREVAMLDLTVEAVRTFGRPGVLYLDNGSTYSGHALETACGRLGINLLHAQPYDPQARGKMERFWRSLREACLDMMMGKVASLHDIQVRLSAWLSVRYHKRPHASLLGKTPGAVWATRKLTAVTEANVLEALTVRATRKVRGDCTLSIGGIDWELREGFLSGRKVVVARSLADADAPPWVEHDEQRYLLKPVCAVANGKLKRKRRKRNTNVDAVDFDPARTLLDVYLGRTPGGAR